MINWKELSNEIRQTLPGIRLLEEEPRFASEDRRLSLHSRRPQRSWQRCCGCCLKKTSARVS